MDNECDFMTEFIPVKEDAIVFCTDKSLNERFTPQYRRCVFVIQNGYTAPCKGNKVKDKVVIRSRALINTHSRFSLYNKYYEENAEEQNGGNERNSKLEEVLDEAATKRRVVLLPAKKKQQEPPTDCQNDQSKKFTIFETNDGISPVDTNHNKFNTHQESHQESQLDDFISPTSSRNVKSYKRFNNFSPNFRARRSSRNNPNYKDESEDIIYSRYDNFKSSIRRSTGSSRRFRKWSKNFRETHNYLDNSDESEPIVYSHSPYLYKNNNNYLQSQYRWSRADISKEDLDRELDSYMAEVHFKPKSAEEDNVESFVQEYIFEKEKYCNGEDENYCIDIY